MECELCGRSTGELFLVEVDGVKLQVCRGCTKHGKFICKVRQEEPLPKNRPKAAGNESEPQVVIVPDYGSRIRKRRNELGLKRQELARKLNETESVVRRLEHEEMVPSDRLVSKIEKVMGIKLRGEYQPVKPPDKSSSKPLTLGDVVKIKK